MPWHKDTYDFSLLEVNRSPTLTPLYTMLLELAALDRWPDYFYMAPPFQDLMSVKSLQLQLKVGFVACNQLYSSRVSSFPLPTAI